MPVLPATRPNLPSAVASEDKEKRHLACKWRFSLASWGALLPKTMLENVTPTKHKKAGGAKIASLGKSRRKLLDFSFRACVFQLLLRFVSSSLGHRFLDGLRCTVDQV